ncbi:MAG: hypothetical protein QM770_16865 [Tepidisphaeraceae bacterium]
MSPTPASTSPPAQLKQTLATLSRQAGVTCLLTTHLMDQADACDRVALLDGGKIVALDAPATLTQQVGGQVILLRTDDPAAAQSTLKSALPQLDTRIVDGQLLVESSNPSTLLPQLIEALPGQVKSLNMHSPTLEDVFLRLTGKRLIDDTPIAVVTKARH